MREVSRGNGCMFLASGVRRQSEVRPVTDCDQRSESESSEGNHYHPVPGSWKWEGTQKTRNKDDRR
jgi:hypothetical protein